MRARLLRPARAVSGLLLLLAMAACATEAPPPPAPSNGPASPMGEYPWPAATSADGRHRLQIQHMEWSNWPGKPGGPRFGVQAGLSPLGPDALLAFANPLREVVTSDGALHEQAGSHWDVGSAWGNLYLGEIDVGAEGARLSLLALEVPVLRVRSWEVHTFRGIGRGATEDLAAPPFSLRVTGEPKACFVAASGGSQGFLVHDWACGAAEVLDAKGTRLAGHGGGGTGGTSVNGFSVDPLQPGGAEPPDIAYPVTVTLRVPKEYDVETVRFEFRELVLPPRPVAVPAMVEPVPGQAPPRRHSGAAAWSEWSAPVRGVSARFWFPNYTPRGERVASGIALRFAPSGLPEGVTHFDAYDLDRGIRLLLRDPATGRTVEIPAVVGNDGPPGPPRVWENEKDLPEPWCTPIRDGATRELQAWFPLAQAWEALLPGTWQVRVLATVKDHPFDPPPHPEGTPAPEVWTGTLRTEPLTISIGEAQPRRLRYLVPKRLRLVPSGGPGSGVIICCLDEDREAVDIETRYGFAIGVTVRRDGGGGAESISGGSLAVADQLPSDHAGPFTGEYEVEVFETGEEPRYHRGIDRLHPTYRTLWKGTFRVTATAAEIEALRR